MQTEAFLAALKSNAEELRRINRLINATFNVRGLSKVHWAAWVAATNELHTRWDQLAFPGGISKELELLRQGDIAAASKALLYMENPPYSFRSQYIAKDFRRCLNKIEKQLPPELQERFSNYKKMVSARKVAKAKKMAQLTPDEQITALRRRKERARRRRSEA
jgi:hypothetical protein